MTNWLPFWTIFVALTIGPAIVLGATAGAWAAQHPLPGFAVAGIALGAAMLGFFLGLIVAPFVIVAVFA